MAEAEVTMKGVKKVSEKKKTPSYNLAVEITKLMAVLKKTLVCPFCSGRLDFIKYLSYDDDHASLELSCERCGFEYGFKYRSQRWTLDDVKRRKITEVAKKRQEEQNNRATDVKEAGK